MKRDNENFYEYARRTNHWSTRLIDLDACDDAIEFALDFDTPQEAWDACERGDWMVYWLHMDAADREEEVSDLMMTCATQMVLAVEMSDLGMSTEGHDERLDAIENARKMMMPFGSYDPKSCLQLAAHMLAERNVWEATFWSYSASRKQDAPFRRIALGRQMAAIARRHFPHPPMVRTFTREGVPS